MTARWIYQCFGVAFAYGVTGYLSLMLPIPTGYATVAWAPAGIALVASLIYGYRIWPGVLLGSFLVNFWTGPDMISVTKDFSFLAPPLLIACGAALQSAVGRCLVERFARFPNQLDHERQIFRFLLWGGLVGCLVSPLIGNTALLASGAIQRHDFLPSLATSWAGDVIGVFVFSPILLVWLQKPALTWRTRRLPVTVPIVIAFTLTIIAVNTAANWERQRLSLQFEQQASALTSTLQENLEKYEDVLHYLAGFSDASEQIRREEFRKFVSRPFARLIGLQALSWNPRILDRDREAFERGTREAGFPNFRITERSPEGQLIPALKRAEYVAVSFIEPFDGNKNAFGFDVASNRMRLKALHQARDSGRPVATARITLVQETRKQFGLLVFNPIYRKGLPHETQEDRRRNLTGFMVGVFRGGDIVETALAAHGKQRFAYQLFDDSADKGNQFLHKNQATGVFSMNEAGVFDGKTAIGRVFPINFGGRKWRFEVSPTQDYLSQHSESNPWLIFIGGFFMTSLVGGFTLLVSGRRQLLGQLVAKRTEELQLSENRLAEAQRIALMGNWNWTAESDDLWWSEEIYRIFELDSTTFQSSLETVHSFVHDEDQTMVKQHLDDAMEHHTAFTIHYRIVLRSGVEKVVQEHCEIVQDQPGRRVRLIGTIQDITERVRLDRMKSEFVSTVSHELRTPLTSINGSLSLLSGGVVGELSEKALSLIDVAKKNAERLIRLVNDILDIEKLESGKMGFNFQEIEIEKLVSDAVAVNAGYATEYSVNFVFQKTDRQNIVRADSNRINQVISNLLSNAAKFSPNGGQVTISVANHEDIVRVSVADQGLGISPEFRAHIFGRFAQADSSDKRQIGGTGLGLNIALSIIKKHQGEIDFESEPDTGTTFYFDLPVVTRLSA